jgi:hypothetical protein
MLCVDHKLKGSVCWGCRAGELEADLEMYKSDYNRQHESCVPLFKHKTLLALAFELEKKKNILEKNNTDLNISLKETEGLLVEAKRQPDQASRDELGKVRIELEGIKSVLERTLNSERDLQSDLERVSRERDDWKAKADAKAKPRRRKAKKKAKKPEPPQNSIIDDGGVQ